MADRAIPDAFANDLTGVYATDPDYGANLIAIMKLYNLYRFDGPVQSVPSVQPQSAQAVDAGDSASRPERVHRPRPRLPQPPSRGADSGAPGRRPGGRRAGDHSRTRFAGPRARDHLGRERGRVSGRAPARRADTGRGRADRRAARARTRRRRRLPRNRRLPATRRPRERRRLARRDGRRRGGSGCAAAVPAGRRPAAARRGQLPAPARRRRDHRRPVPAAVHHGGDDRVFRHREGAGRPRRAPLPRRGRADGHPLGAARRLRLDAVQGAPAVLPRARREDRRAQLRRDQLRHQVGRARAVRTAT